MAPFIGPRNRGGAGYYKSSAYRNPRARAAQRAGVYGNAYSTSFGYQRPNTSNFVRQSKSAYAFALCAPMKSKPCIIPDILSYKTVSFIQEETIHIGTNVLNSGGVLIQLTAAPFYNVETAASNDTLIVYGAAVPFTRNAQIATEYKAVRPVAMGVEYSFAGTTSLDEGFCTASYKTSLDIKSDGAAFYSSSVAQNNARDFASSSIINNKLVRYRPMDNSDLDFDELNSATYEYAAVQFHFSGVAASQWTSFKIKILWEGLPTDGSIAEAAVSLSDPVSYAAARNTAAILPPILDGDTDINEDAASIGSVFSDAVASLAIPAITAWNPVAGAAAGAAYGAYKNSGKRKRASSAPGSTGPRQSGLYTTGGKRKRI